MTKNENKIIKQALQILESRISKPDSYISNPKDAVNYIKLNIATREHEVFVAIFLDTQHGIIEYNEMFRGTVNGSSVHPREVIKQALAVNASAVIFAHNHPSTKIIPSAADRHITKTLTEGLKYIDVKVLDHFIIGGIEHFSFAENGLL